MTRFARRELADDPGRRPRDEPGAGAQLLTATAPDREAAMTLVAFWFIVLAVLWTGFFVLEGFDFGVGMLHGVVGTDEAGRRAAIDTIGPLWDGNEVWLIVAAAGMFAAFPGWYATMFSGFYLVRRAAAGRR